VPEVLEITGDVNRSDEALRAELPFGPLHRRAGRDLPTVSEIASDGRTEYVSPVVGGLSFTWSYPHARVLGVSGWSFDPV
jgi:hypothetical protein